MFDSKALSTVVAFGAMAFSTMAGATVLTIKPANDNGLGAAGVVSSTQGQFNTDGATGALNTVLSITNTGAFTETGSFSITNFTLASAITGGNPQGLIPSGVGFLGTYDVWATFNFTGNGVWTPCLACGTGYTYTATSGNYSFELFAQGHALGSSVVDLGTGVLSGLTVPPQATIVTAGADAGKAYTTLSGVFGFTPKPGTTGANGFFVAPSPFNIAISVGNFGGNLFNTTFTGDPTTGVTVLTPGSGLGPVTGNMNFVNNSVPEPGAITLAGIALIGLGLAGKRRKAKAAA